MKLKHIVKLAIRRFSHGTLENYNKTSRFQSSPEISHMEFLKQGIELKCKMIIVDKDTFSFDNFHHAEEIKEINSKFRKYEGKLFHLRIYYSLDGVIYEYEKIEDWFWEFQEEIKNFTKINEDYGMSQVNAETEHLMKIADKIAQEHWYFRVHTRRGEAKSLVSDYVTENNLNLDEDQIEFIEDRAQYILQTKYRKTQGQQLKEDIQKLQNAGNTKVKIINLLGITSGLYEKYM